MQQRLTGNEGHVELVMVKRGGNGSESSLHIMDEVLVACTLW